MKIVQNGYLYISIYVTGWCCFPKQLTLHSIYTFLSVHSFPGNRTHELISQEVEILATDYFEKESDTYFIKRTSLLIPMVTYSFSVSNAWGSSEFVYRGTPLCCPICDVAPVCLFVDVRDSQCGQVTADFMDRVSSPLLWEGDLALIVYKHLLEVSQQSDHTEEHFPTGLPPRHPALSTVDWNLEDLLYPSVKSIQLWIFTEANVKYQEASMTLSLNGFRCTNTSWVEECFPSSCDWANTKYNQESN